jgi:tetratricopeptide (TPR) repeat protein
MRDSLLLDLKNQKEDSLKARTLFFLFNAAIYTNPEEAKTYAEEQLRISKKNNYKQPEGLANYNLGIYYNNKSAVDSASYFYKKALDSYKEINSITNIALAYGALSEVATKKGNYDESLTIMDSVVAIYKTNDDHYRLGNSYAQIGAIYMEKGSYRIALEETLKSVRILDTINKPIRRADAYSQLGDIEFELGNFENALAHKEEALLIYRKYKDKVYESSSLNDIAKILLQLGKPSLSLMKLDSSLILSRELNIKDSEATALINKGEVYLAQGEFKKAQKQFSESLVILEEIENPIGLAGVLTKIAVTNSRLNNSGLALSQLNRAIIIADSINAKKELGDAFYERSILRKETGDYLSALLDYENYKKQNDSIFNTVKSQQIEELRTVYDTEKKEQQIAMQESEILLLEQKAKVSNLEKIILGGGLGLSLLVFGIGFYGIRQKMKRNKLERERVDAELAFKKKELTSHALQLAKKNETLENLKQKAKELKEAEKGNSGYQQLIRTINFDLQDDNNWKNFARYFEEVHKDFNSNVKTKYPQVTSNELRLLALLKMNLSSKEIANILNISPEGIKKARYRLRKKLDITTEDSLQDLALSL